MRTRALRRLSTWMVLALAACHAATQVARAQQIDPQGIVYNVQAPNQRLEMVVNSSRILTLEEKIPTAQVGNRDVLDLTALSPTQVQVFAKKAGVTQINLWNERNEIKSIDVVVYGDSRELKMILQAQFPRTSLTVTPLANSVIIGGFVDRPDLVNRIIRIAEDYHPNIINNITVGGVQQVLLDVKVMEVSRTDLRQLGVDWSYFTGGDFAVSSVSGLIQSFTNAGPTFAGQTFAVGLTQSNSSFFGVIDALKERGVAKIVADPKIMTVSGRPARFLQGGSFPVLVPQSLGTVSVEYREYGTEIDFVPIVLGNGLIRLELRPRVSEPDPALSITINGTTVPALTERTVDTGVEMRAGQTLAIAGLVQQRTTTQVSGLPVLCDMPYVGTLFRRTTSRTNEVETLIMVTPTLVDAMDCHEVPPCGPGMRTTTPNDHELYLKGYVEVPKCCPPCDNPGYGGQGYHGPGPQDGGGYYHGEVPPGGMGPQGMPRSTEEIAPPVPQPPMANTTPAPTMQPGGFRAPSIPSAAPMQRDPAPAFPRVTPLPKAEPLPKATPLPLQSGSPSTSAPRTQPPTARRAAPPAPSQDTNVGAPGRNNRPDRQAPPEPRQRTTAIPASTGPGFIGPTGYDVN